MVIVSEPVHLFDVVVTLVPVVGLDKAMNSVSVPTQELSFSDSSVLRKIRQRIQFLPEVSSSNSAVSNTLSK
jgi:hypothetical protein